MILDKPLPQRSTRRLFAHNPQRAMTNYAQPHHAAAESPAPRGAVFGLDSPPDTPSHPPSPPHHSAPQLHLLSRHRDHRDDYLDGFWPHAASHAEGLRHRRHGC